MKTKIIFVLSLVCIVAIGATLIGLTVSTANYTPDVVEMNRVRFALEQSDDLSVFAIDTIYDFTATDNNGTIIFSTLDNRQVMPLEQRINTAIANLDAVLYLNGVEGGIIVFYTGQLNATSLGAQFVAIIVPLAVLMVLITLAYYVLSVSLYRPFKNLKGFASEIAMGNLDTPLPMDRDNLFGEFSESFDIMREELKLARQKVIAEEKSKKELVATLSHDIKTPVAIVRVASELLELSERDAKKLAQIKVIQEKSLEIDTLITDLFTSSLEDLSELKINIADIESTKIIQLILAADSLNKVIISRDIPNCLVKGDPVRLSQVFGNIISNSYKYSGSDIKVGFTLDNKVLRVSFADSGKPLEKDEMPLLTQKFYRGKNANGKQGAGLGLYICSKLIGKMGGELNIAQEASGLRVDISLALS